MKVVESAADALLRLFAPRDSAVAAPCFGVQFAEFCDCTWPNNRVRERECTYCAGQKYCGACYQKDRYC